ncbi:hypothetical protein AC482_05860 [miscellaneous Crenarchaeota group-15 archaeon DG-45]|uniref:Uncharacterized protein n=1 Tax=miscellaneous Crenarchaeota group-15 archaeon DG-45 TaxID=1685127 RepID=A0A0M0BM53_9ARCH|nr:MAG: hypothetical protein AC482_05860 [miscellaneous Crenarchaeota group-15 archaeon DG-45]
MKCDGCGKEFKTLYGAEGYWLCSSCRGMERITETIRLRDRKAELIDKIKDKLGETDLTTLDAFAKLLDAKRVTIWIDEGELMISGELERCGQGEGDEEGGEGEEHGRM